MVVLCFPCTSEITVIFQSRLKLSFFPLQISIFSRRDDAKRFHKPTEANMSSMSSWLFWLVGSENLSHRLLFFCLSFRSPHTEDWLIFFRLFTFFSLAPARSAKDLFLLLTKCRWVFEQIFLLVRTWERGLFSARFGEDKAQRTFCLKDRNFLWTLERATKHTHMLSTCTYCKLFCFQKDTKSVWVIKWNEAHKDEEGQDFSVLFLLVTFCLQVFHALAL